ncbi:MAG: BrnT family toxin [Chloroflexota bacterium]
MRFEWNEGKARSNLTKHGLTFDEATTVFDDPFAVTIPDDQERGGELRAVTIGYSAGQRLVVVYHVERGTGIRIIGARRASRRERDVYHAG